MCPLHYLSEEIKNIIKYASVYCAMLSKRGAFAVWGLATGRSQSSSETEVALVFYQDGS